MSFSLNFCWCDADQPNEKCPVLAEQLFHLRRRLFPQPAESLRDHCPWREKSVSFCTSFLIVMWPGTHRGTLPTSRRTYSRKEKHDCILSNSPLLVCEPLLRMSPRCHPAVAIYISVLSPVDAGEQWSVSCVRSRSANHWIDTRAPVQLRLPSPSHG